MMRRFSSGSTTPCSRARKRSAASTWTSGTWKWSRNAEVTCSASFFRISPWSTNTQVSRSPSARWTISAATDESTPPDRPQIARPSPTCSRISATCSSMIDAGDQSPSQPQTSKRKLLRMSVPCGVWTTSGWNWMPYRPRSGDSSAATGEAGDEASATKPGGGSKTVSRWLIQQVCSAGRPAIRRPGSRTRSSVRPNSPDLRPLDAAAELDAPSPACRNRCRARARPSSSSSVRSSRRALLVHRRGPAREHDPARDGDA